MVRYISTRVAVMRQGEIVEMAPTETLYAAPQHPYTQLLLSSIPSNLRLQKKSNSRAADVDAAARLL